MLHFCTQLCFFSCWPCRLCFFMQFAGPTLLSHQNGCSQARIHIVARSKSALQIAGKTQFALPKQLFAEQYAVRTAFCWPNSFVLPKWGLASSAPYLLVQLRLPCKSQFEQHIAVLTAVAVPTVWSFGAIGDGRSNCCSSKCCGPTAIVIITLAVSSLLELL